MKEFCLHFCLRLYYIPVEHPEDVEEEESESRLVHSTGNGKLNSVHSCRNNNLT